tara:strand:- start:107 stop:946 length:840 start_codon:yes stop_codon:yes gene_type:complete
MRNRILKKEFWCDEKIIELSPVERLLFLGMTNFADDEGIQVYSAKGLKAKIFPADSISVSVIENGLSKMADLGLIEFGNNGTLIRIRNWKLHQKINRPYPSKFDFIEENNDDSMNIHGTFNERSLPNNKNNNKNNNKKKKKEENKEFSVWYKLYPRKVAKPKALLRFQTALNDHSLEDIMEGTKTWCDYWKTSRTEIRYIPHPSTFLNQERFMDEPDVVEVEVEYKLDTTGNFFIGYCDKCSKSGFYRKEELSHDSKCCKGGILPSRGLNEIQDVNAEA